MNDIIAPHAAVGNTTVLDSSLIGGDVSTADIINTFGTVDLQAILQTVSNSSIVGGNYSNVNIVQ